MYRNYMHDWERRCHDLDDNRIVRPFDWGFEFIGQENGSHQSNQNGSAQALSPQKIIQDFNQKTIPNSDEFFRPAPLNPEGYEFDGHLLKFQSSIETISPANNIVHARFYPATTKDGKPSDRAVIVMPQWNGDVNAHVSICKGLNFFGISALRLSLPYHDWRKPPELERADYLVCSNIGRTIQSIQQGVHDVRRCADWLQLQGIRKIGVMGTSVGSNVGFLSFTHDERLEVGVFNHASSFFGDVVWQGITTAHIRKSLETEMNRDEAREAWLSISPSTYMKKLSRHRRKAKIMVARYDLTFPFELSQNMLENCKENDVPIDSVILPCGHYTSGKSPYKFLVGYHIVSYFVAKLK